MPLEEIARHFITINKLIIFLINAIGFELAFWVYFTNRKERSNQLFFFFTLCLVLWVDFDFLSTFASFLFNGGADWIILFATRMVFVILCPFFLFFYFFSVYFPKYGKRNGAMEIAQSVIWAGFMFLSLTSYIIANVMTDPLDATAAKIVPGPLMPLFIAGAVMSLVVSLHNFFSKSRLLSPQEKGKFYYLLVSLSLFGFFNILFNIVVPAYFDTYLGPVSLFGDYSIILILGFTAYYILKEQLFGIKVILVEILVGLMGASLAVIPFLIDVLWQQILLFSLFLLFCLFSYLLIKGTMREYREKETLEREIQKRTQELETAKINLEEMNAVLEVRVTARTEELQKLNQTLEEKVKERTGDLQQKIFDLEKFQRLTVGRELKMIELKKEIEKQKKKIAQLELKIGKPAKASKEVKGTDKIKGAALNIPIEP